MNKLFTFSLISLALLAGSFFSAIEPDEASKPIGKVVSIQGAVQADSAEGESRVLKKNSPIYVGDLIRVSDNAHTKLKFTDGGTLSLIASTEYRIDAYQFSGKSSQYVASLLLGGLRAATGKIPKQNPEGYKVETPSATIGIRGTIFEINIVASEVFFGCSEGSVRVFNDFGNRALAPGQFVSANSFGQLGDVTNERPNALSEKVFIPQVTAPTIRAPAPAAPAEAPTAAPAETPTAAPAEAPAAPAEAPAAPASAPAAPDTEPTVPESTAPVESIHIAPNVGNPPC